MPRRALTAGTVAVTLLLGAAAATVAARWPASRPATAAGAPASSATVTDTAETVPTRVAPPGVAPLRHLSQPDLFVTVDDTLTKAEVRQVRRATDARRLTVLDVGKVRVAGQRVRALGVNPSQFRGFAPPPTAASDALWQNVVAGDLAASYAFSRDRELGVGETVVVRGAGALRLGAAAVFDLPKVDVVVARGTGQRLGLRSRAALVLSAPGRSGGELAAGARGVLGSSARIVTLGEESTAPASGKPRTYLELYQAASRICPGLHWSILAAIGQIESGHGRNVGPSSKGALGPMQFMPSSWKRWATDGDSDGKADIMNPYDAVYAASRYLCSYAPGTSREHLKRALFGYNHADWYVRDVLELARLYR